MNQIAAYSLGSQVNLTIAHRATRSFNQVVRRGGFMQSIDQVTRMLPSTETLLYPAPAHVFTCFTLPPPFKVHTSFCPTVRTDVINFTVTALHIPLRNHMISRITIQTSCVYIV